MTGARSAISRGVEYYENRCAWNPPLVLVGLVLPIVVFVGCLVLALRVDTNWWVGVGFTPIDLLVPITLMYRNWPTAIRIDEEGIRIGAVDRNVIRRKPLRVEHQNWGRFSVGWDAVQRVEVVTDRDQVRQLRKSRVYFTLSNRWTKPRGQTGVRVGVLSAPWMRSAMVVRLDVDRAVVPPTRGAWFFSNIPGNEFRTLAVGETSSVWVVPTRRPAQLAQALAARARAGG